MLFKDRDKRDWQPLAEHLRAVAEAAGARGAKFVLRGISRGRPAPELPAA